jgi:tetratricopeptide (TPR) repeat protein
MAALPSRNPSRPRFLAVSTWVSALTLLALAGTAFSCYPAPSDRPRAARRAASEAEWSWLQQAKKDLDAKRARLDSALEAPSKDVAALKAEVSREGGELNRRLVAFLNADPPVEGEPLSARQQAAIRMKSDEDILLGQVFITEGGDFQRAIEIYEAALGLDPGYDRLRTELQNAKARRYVSPEAFDELKEGMSDEEVRVALGQPNLHNVRAYEEHKVVGWFYPKDESGAAAGVWFEREGGALKVYKLDFDAIAPHAAPPGGPPIA